MSNINAIMQLLNKKPASQLEDQQCLRDAVNLFRDALLKFHECLSEIPLIRSELLPVEPWLQVMR